MWNTSIKLPTSNVRTKDKDGFQVDSYEYLEGIPASRKDTTRDDELLAKQSGYAVDAVYVIDAAVYAGQSFLIDELDNTRYSIERTFQGDRKHFIELTVSAADRGKVI